MKNSQQILGSPTPRRQTIAGANQIRASRSRLVVALLVCAGGLVPASCRPSQVSPNSNTGPADIQSSTFTTPPFSTKEPERYQAIRVTSFSETGSSRNSSSSQSNQVLIARDGEKRREEYSAGAGVQIVYLEIPAGRFILLPASRMYADLSSASGVTEPNGSSDDSPELSADQLLNEPHGPATYEILGTESLSDRMTRKYRVVELAGADSSSETLIWIDEALGIPVRSEMASTSDGRTSKVTMELKDIRLEVDQDLFSWPSDYKKVEARMILDLLRGDGKPSSPKQE